MFKGTEISKAFADYCAGLYNFNCRLFSSCLDKHSQMQYNIEKGLRVTRTNMQQAKMSQEKMSRLNTFLMNHTIFMTLLIMINFYRRFLKNYLFSNIRLHFSQNDTRTNTCSCGKNKELH